MQPKNFGLHYSGDSVGIRTQDPQLRRLLLYPAELRNRPSFLKKGLQRYYIFLKSLIFVVKKH